MSTRKLVGYEPNPCDPEPLPVYEDQFSAAPPQPAAQPEYESFQQRVRPWLLACFGVEIASDKKERNHRFLEESLELVQACGCAPSEAHQLVDYVFGRPAGEPHQEVGGVMVTLAALCLAQDLDMHTNGETELARIWTKVEQIRAKQAAKPKHSPLPEQPEPGMLTDERIDTLWASTDNSGGGAAFVRRFARAIAREVLSTRKRTAEQNARIMKAVDEYAAVAIRGSALCYTNSELFVASAARAEIERLLEVKHE